MHLGRRAALAAVSVITALEAFTHIGQRYPDSAGYIKTALFFEGEISRTELGSAYFRLLRPVVPFVASLLNHVIGIEASFAVFNLVLWFASSILMFKLTEFLTERIDTAFVASSFFTASIPLLLYGGAVLTDMSGYFFVLLGTYLILKLDLGRATYVKVIASSLVVALGVLSREFAASVIVTLVIWVLLTRGSWRRVILMALIVAVVAFAWSTAVGISYNSWLSYNVLNASQNASFESQNAPLTLRLWTWIRTVRDAFRPEILLLTIVGGASILKRRTKLPAFAASLLGPAIVTLGLAVAGAGTDFRYTFTMFPGMLPIASLGVIWLANQIATFLTTKDGRSDKLTTILTILCVVAFIIETNLITMRFLSLPWNPYVAP
jgi:4-amino-4-deoxy-L-arabinose transferase-like glycosyltransferase